MTDTEKLTHLLRTLKVMLDTCSLSGKVRQRLTDAVKEAEAV